MTEKQERLLALYRNLWVELNTISALRSQLDERVREIHARQRRIANQIAAVEDVEEKPVEPGSERPANWKAV